MALITISIRDMALFTVSKRGAVVLFPSVGHQTRVTFGPDWNAQAIDLTARFALTIHENGKPLKAARTEPPAGQYSVDLTWAAGGKRAAVTKANLAGSVPPRLNGRLSLAGGRLCEYPAVVKKGLYAERLWDFGAGRQHRMTDRIDFELDAKPGATYALVGGGVSVPLTPGTPVWLWNGDHDRYARFPHLLAAAPAPIFLGPAPTPHPRPARTERAGLGPLETVPEFAELTALAGLGRIVPRITSTGNETYDDRPCPNAFVSL